MTALTCDILWNGLSDQEWDDRLAAVPHSNCLQSRLYGVAFEKTEPFTAKRGLMTINNQPAGLIQMMEVRYGFGFVHGITLDRGPLWLNGFGGIAHIKAFFETLNALYPRRWGRKRRLVPEMEDSAAADKILKQAGWVRRDDIAPYQTLWWDCTISKEEARQALKSGWRQSLQKAEKSDLHIEWDNRHLPFLLKKYALDRQKRQFGGPSPQFLTAMARLSPQGEGMICVVAKIEGRIIAGQIYLLHGQSATYQVGWSGDEGRTCCAHHFLLWHARTMLQRKGIDSLDLGGVHDNNPGLTHFKEGTGAWPYRLIGFYS